MVIGWKNIEKTLQKSLSLHVECSVCGVFESEVKVPFKVLCLIYWSPHIAFEQIKLSIWKTALTKTRIYLCFSTDICIQTHSLSPQSTLAPTTPVLISCKHSEEFMGGYKAELYEHSFVSWFTIVSFCRADYFPPLLTISDLFSFI